MPQSPPIHSPTDRTPYPAKHHQASPHPKLHPHTSFLRRNAPPHVSPHPHSQPPTHSTPPPAKHQTPYPPPPPPIRPDIPHLTLSAPLPSPEPTHPHLRPPSPRPNTWPLENPPITGQDAQLRDFRTCRLGELDMGIVGAPALGEHIAS